MIARQGACDRSSSIDRETARVVDPITCGILGSSPALVAALRDATTFAPSERPVLILGESGVGKESCAKFVHACSGRKGSFVAINCAAIPASLVESHLFGHERGAFTGATERHVGIFEQAQGGTVFLDEVGELHLEIQAKLLRALQEGEIVRVGGTRTIEIDARIIAATNRDLERDACEGRFRLRSIDELRSQAPCRAIIRGGARQQCPCLRWRRFGRRQIAELSGLPCKFGTDRCPGVRPDVYSDREWQD
jgi:transcriptional regulator with GAF, ATPase, and Fis domain